MLPIYQDPNQNVMLMQTKWASELNPLLARAFLDGNLLKNVVLASGQNVVNHLLNRTMQGFVVTDINAAVTIYRSAPLNNKILTLTASGAATVSLWCF